MDSCRGWRNLLRLSVRQGGFDAHTTLRNKDLLAQIRYSSFFFFNFSAVYVCLIATRNLIVVSKPLVTPISMVSLFSMHMMCMNSSNMLKDCTFMHL